MVTPPTPSTPSTPPTQNPTSSQENYISNTHSIASELDKHFIISTQEALDTATQTILSQINQVQSFKSITTYAMSNLYNRSIQAQISKPATHLAYNPYTPTLSDTQSDFSLYSQAFTQNASYNTHFFNLEERIGYRFTLTPSDTLKPYAGVGLHLYYQPSYSESGDFTYSQNSLFFGSFALLAGLEYRKVFSSSSLYLGATLGYSIPSFGDTTYSMHFLNSLLVFKNSSIFTAQIQGGAEFAITPTSYLSVELNYKYNDTRYFDADGILGYRYLF